MMTVRDRRALGAVALAVLLACSGQSDEETRVSGKSSQRLSVYVVNYPLQYFTQRIAGDHVEVILPAPRDVDPADWTPTAEIITAYQGADLILENGAGYARWTGYATLPRASRVDTSAGFRDRWIPQEGGVTHGHGPGGEHSHLGTAFTTWLDPTLAVEQARAITEALLRLRPAAEADFRAGLAALEVDLVDLDRRLATALAPLSGEALLFSHPVYPYLARRYRLQGRSLHWEPGVMPEPAAWRELEAMLDARPARMMIFEGEPHPEAKSRLRSLGVHTVVFAPSANRPESGDWLSAMQSNAERVRAATARNES
jgi:zinc transport system substrate-binding protein